MPSIRIKNNGPVLLLHTIFIRHRDCFLMFVATDGKDGYGLEFEKLGQLFLNFKLMPTKNHQKIIFFVFSDEFIFS